MKELSLYKIRDLAIASGRGVFTTQQLANLIGKSKAVATVYMARLVSKGLATRLLKGRIAFTDDDFVIATQLVEPSYVSLDSALMLHDLSTQITRRVQCVTSWNSKVLDPLGIEYHKIPGTLFFGYEKQRRGNSYAFVAVPEKALIDGLYLGIYNEERATELAVHGLDLSKAIGMLGKFKGKGSIRLKRVIGSLAKKN